MVHRIFDGSEIPSSCILRGGPTGSVRARVLRISREEVVLDTPVTLVPETRVDVVLQLAHARPVLRARVLGTGARGLQLEWELFDAVLDEDDLEALLMEAAGLVPARPAEAPPMPAPRSVRVDGEIDLEASLRSNSRVVDTTRISARHVRVLDMDAIAALIREAVDDVLEQHGGKLGDSERERLIEETEKAFTARLREFEAEKQDLESRAGELETKLGQAKALLAEEQEKVIEAEQFTMSNAGILELEQRMGRILDRSVAAGGLSAESEDELRDLMARLLDNERQKISEKARLAQGDRIDLLERKISRLARSLQDTEQERDVARRHAHALESKGIAFQNIMEPGMANDDPFRQEKLDLLKELVEENQVLRDHMNTSSESDVQAPAPS